ncbi:MAG: tRNA uridine-5-carboxymethylaminomethyl(34) synthesis enzyme MnmG [Deltaproteobacteria bacterium]|jgi:tRNA uridine 5-carboxymethylaminomethyl modification enzyme|nr:tRNA uridine-5-carboxymethylaminomethyl(34) synthesis enzyme MnmG [Deltaproteobacteria bacterium]
MLYDVIVAGGGHAGLEASFAAARLSMKTLLVTLSLETIGTLSCNPAFGGPAKGGLLREVDALGGHASLGADESAIQCRILGESKGPAARATRNLVDRTTYRNLAREFAEKHENLELLAGEAMEILVRDGKVLGLKLVDGRTFRCGALVLTGGTFWNGVIYFGLNPRPGGRVGESPATNLRETLANVGHPHLRLSTSTAPRLKADTIDNSVLEEQPGDPGARPFSTLRDKPINLVSCRLTWTNGEVHRIVRENVKSSIIYADNPVSTGPRYCPSLEDKIMRFPDKERHQIFLEKDGPELVYPGGLPTGLDPEVQRELINRIKGLEKTVIVIPGYAIEYDYADPRGLSPALESLKVRGLFFAGQINGTSGYEEAAAQGIWAGVGAALRASGSEPIFLGRNEALMGVMFDDLTSLGVSEPYRMFTGRAEYRLSLREDNADLRLSPLAMRLGLLDKERTEIFEAKKADMEKARRILSLTKITPAAARALGEAGGIPEKNWFLREAMAADEFLKRPKITANLLAGTVPELGEIRPTALLTLETEIKFRGYLDRQEEEIRKLKKQESERLDVIPDFRVIPGLTGEAAEALTLARPSTLGQAGRIRGVTSASVSALAVYLKKKRAADVLKDPGKPEGAPETPDGH